MTMNQRRDLRNLVDLRAIILIDSCLHFGSKSSITVWIFFDLRPEI